MPHRSSLSVGIPLTDLPSFLLDDVPESTSNPEDDLFIKPFLYSAERPDEIYLSLVQFKYYVKCFAAGLRRAGLLNGDRVMLVAPNYIYGMIICLGTIAASGIICTSQPDFKVREYVDQLKRDKPRFIFICDEDPLRSNVLEAWEKLNGSRNNSWLFDEFLDAKSRPSNPRNSHEYWDSLLDEINGPRYEWTKLRSLDQCRTPCQIFYTSGTSGPRKSALVSHRNLVAAFTGVGYRVREDVRKYRLKMNLSSETGAPQRLLHTVSLARGFGTSLPLSICKSRQRMLIEVYFMSKTWVDMEPYLDIIQYLRITQISCAPFTLSKLFNRVVTPNQYDFSAVQSITVTGAPGAQVTLDRAKSFLIANRASEKVRVERAYAITEAGSIVTCWHLADPPDTREGCQGRLEPNMEAKIILSDGDDPSQTEAGDKEPGELWLKCPSQIEGYYLDDEATRQAFTPDGWYRTGDLGYFHDGRLFLMDRKKDILKTPDNIPPLYVEGVLLEHSDILDAGVIGIYDASKEMQDIRAYVVKKNNSEVSEKQIQDWMAKESAETAHLKGGVVFMQALPRDSMGKLSRKSLRELAQVELDRPDIAGLTVAQATGF